MADSAELQQDEIPDETAPPQPKNNMLTVALLLANVVAVLAFVYLLVMDYQKRQDWSRAVFMADLNLVGVPQELDDQGPTAAYETLPRQHQSGEQLMKALNQRSGKSPDPIAPVDEVLQSDIKPKTLTPEMLKEHFEYFGEQEPVKTLEDEIRRLQKKLPQDIEAAAVGARDSAPDEAAKKKLLQEILLSLAYNVHQVDALAKKVNAAKGVELDEMLLDAAQRRMYVDLLAPMELFRAGETPSYAVQKVADLDAYKLDELKNLLDKHLTGLAGKLDPSVQTGAHWDSIEKRRAIAFFLTDLAYLRKPNGEPLYPNGLRRAQAIAGLYDVPAAIQNLTQTWNTLEQQVLHSIKTDREGMEAKLKDAKINIPGFVGKHQNEIDRLLDIKRSIQNAEERLARLTEQKNAAIALYKERKEHMDELGKAVSAARKETARQLSELRSLQKELFEAQRQLAEAAERNFQLEATIREKEGLKGPKTP
ncbi:MAG: hypothetical protein HY040_03900 [Planctomycetes bacterium]|nr:hypothetical protein [Planctomycetota bacterium]